mmetsp:Transcript_56442/g.178588  ORF Transcript_56442/g.178588 Transcript_56442/m.178588 type:complete len:220 (+) Transcript_56442:48-707(+)
MKVVRFLRRLEAGAGAQGDLLERPFLVGARGHVASRRGRGPPSPRTRAARPPAPPPATTPPGGASSACPPAWLRSHLPPGASPTCHPRRGRSWTRRRTCSPLPRHPPPQPRPPCGGASRGGAPWSHCRGPSTPAPTRPPRRTPRFARSAPGGPSRRSGSAQTSAPLRRHPPARASAARPSRPPRGGWTCTHPPRGAGSDAPPPRGGSRSRRSCRSSRRR